MENMTATEVIKRRELFFSRKSEPSTHSTFDMYFPVNKESFDSTLTYDDILKLVTELSRQEVSKSMGSIKPKVVTANYGGA